MKKTITIPRTQEHYLGNVIVTGKKFLGRCEMICNSDTFTLHWTFKAPQYLDLFLKKIPAEIVGLN